MYDSHPHPTPLHPTPIPTPPHSHPHPTPTPTPLPTQPKHHHNHHHPNLTTTPIPTPPHPTHHHHPHPTPAHPQPSYGDVVAIRCDNACRGPFKTCASWPRSLYEPSVTDLPKDYFIGMWAITLFSQCQWSNPEKHWWIHHVNPLCRFTINISTQVTL